MNETLFTKGNLMATNVSPSPETAAKIEAVNQYRAKTKCSVRDACAHVGIPVGTYQSGSWAIRKAVKKNHAPKPKPAPVEVEQETDYTRAVPVILETIDELVSDIDKRLSTMETLVQTRARLMAMKNEAVLEDRMNDVEQSRVAELLRG